MKFENQKGEINWFGERWIKKWFGLVSLEEKWFQEIWTTRELEIISKLNNEIEMIEDKEQEKIVANKKLIEIMNEFKKEACA